MRIKEVAMFDTGSTGFMLACTMPVPPMTPGLAFFYGGLSRRKNAGNTMLMVFANMGIALLYSRTLSGV